MLRVLSAVANLIRLDIRENVLALSHFLVHRPALSVAHLSAPVQQKRFAQIE